MRILTKTLVASAAAAALVALAGSASAAVYVNDWSINTTTGQITVTFGDGSNGADLPGGIGDVNASGTAGDHGTAYTHTYDSGTGDFTDTFDFFLPTGNVINAAVSTSDLVFTGITFNGVAGSVDNTPGFETAHVGSVHVVNGNTQELVITGSGVGTAGWSGTATFTPTPEPATWALMIMGFGGAGALLRRRRAVFA